MIRCAFDVSKEGNAPAHFFDFSTAPSQHSNDILSTKYQIINGMLAAEILPVGDLRAKLLTISRRKGILESKT